jgi:uncharacterized iron-regulated membrane protein
MNYDIHTGAVLGLPGKILVFFAGLIIASLPITGFYIWWGRKQKEKNKKLSHRPNGWRKRNVLTTRVQTVEEVSE